MAKTTFEIDIDTSKAIAGAKDLREQFNILEDKLFQLAKAGKEGTKEFEAIRNALSRTKERIDDLNESIDLLKPEAKFQAFINLTSAISSGFAAAQGAAQLFGNESEELDKSLIKVQAAMALAQGVQGLAGMGDSLKVVGTMLKQTTLGTKLATAAQWLWNNAIKANPIMAIITAIGALVTGIIILTRTMGDEDEAQKEVIKNREKELELMQEADKAMQKEADFRKNLAAAQGKSAKEQLALNEELSKQRIKQIDNEIQTARKLINERLARAKNADKEERDNLYKANSDTLKLMKDLANERLDIQNNLKIQSAKLETDANNESKNKAKETNKTIVDNAKELNKLLEDLRAQNIQNAEQRELKILELSHERERKEVILKGATNELLLQLDLKYANDRADIENKYIDQEEARKKKEKEDREKEYQEAVDFAQKLQDDEDKRRDDKRKKDEDDAKKAKQARQAEINANFKMTSDAIGALIELNNSYPANAEKNAKRSFQINKALQLAQATINGVQAVQNVLADPTLVGPARYIAAAIAGVTALANINKIAQTKFEPSSTSGGGGGGGNLGTFTQGGGGQPPQGLTAQNTVTQLNPDGTVAGQGNREAAPMKAYVVESESRAVTERVNKLSNNSKIG
jgi:hypothetical protein